MALLASAASLPPEIRLQTDVDFAYLQGVGLQADGGGPWASAARDGVYRSAQPAGRLRRRGRELERMLVRIEAKLQGGKLRSRVIAVSVRRLSSVLSEPLRRGWAPGSDSGTVRYSVWRT